MIPHITAVVMFLAIALTYFSPVLEGKKLKQGDIVHFKGTSKEIKDYREKTGEEALWTNSLFGGMPAFQISTIYSGNLIGKVDTLISLGLPKPAKYLFLSMLGFYLLMLCLGVNPWVGLIGSAGFALSSYFLIILEAGHNTKAHAIAYMAPVIAGFVLTYKGKELLGFAVTALTFALELKTNHLQITYYLGLILLIYGIFELYKAVKDKSLPVFVKRSSLLITAIILALGTNIASIWSTYEYGKATIRGKSELTLGEENNQTSGLDKDYATAWSYGVGETFTLLVPNFKGGASEPVAANPDLLKDVSPQNKQIMAYAYKYHGEQPFTSGPVYIGSIIIFLFVLGLFFVKGNLRWVMLIATILSVVLAWGKNFMPVTDFFLEYVPGYNKFRAVSMTLVIAELTIPVLGFLALDRIIKQKEDLIKDKRFLYGLGIVGGLSLLMYLAPGMFTDFQNDMADAQLGQQLQQAGLGGAQVGSFFSELEEVRETMFKADALRSLVFILLGAGILWLYGVGKLKINVVYIVLGLLVVTDLWMVDKRFLNNKKDGRGNYISWESKRESKVPYQPTAADKQILQDPDPNFRVYNLTARPDQDSRTSYFHKSLGGYHGAKLRRYQEVIDYHLNRGNRKVVNMLNTKYYLSSQGEQGDLIAVPNPNALGNAWFVEEYKIVANADSEITALSSFDPEKTAIVDKRFENKLTPLSTLDSLSKVKLTQYQPNNLVYESNSKSGGFVVFSEIYYDKGWKAFIDGEKVDHVRVNYILRGMYVPEGKHTIEFKFEPTSYYVGNKISLASSILVILVVAFSLFKHVRLKE